MAQKEDDIEYHRNLGLNTLNLVEQKRGRKLREPQVEILELKDDYIRFVLSNTDVSVANALRRIIYAEVPTMALDTVEILENTTCMTDEFLAHRLGLIPLTSQAVETFNFYRDCECPEDKTHCSFCAVEFTLEAHCNDDQPLSVTTLDLISSNPDVVPVHSSDENKILLLKLGKNQEIRLRLIARKGIGKEHAKWCPVSVCTYQFEPDIRINQSLHDDMSEVDKDRFVRSCPTHVYRYDAQARQIQIEDANSCMYCGECVKKAKYLNVPDLVHVGARPGRFIFTVECVGQLRPEQVVLAGLQELRSKLNTIESELQIPFE
eukprot:TRINITY_DN18126_c0_g1_i1.p1 TRINITY_DN18126_c0_g1~~TRINITY_DN18126_c0_g1_i1.p1  ORF type:complete len:320 (-),score=26.90 TRINITY_DN18126_c0_g1_i1:19-978(-)